MHTYLSSLLCMIVMINLMFSMSPTHELLLSLTFPYLYSSSVSTLLLGHVLYSADLMPAILLPHPRLTM